MSKRSCCHISHLPVSEDGRSWPSRGLGFDPGPSTFRYELSVVKVSVCPSTHDPQVTWHEKTVTVVHHVAACPPTPLASFFRLHSPRSSVPPSSFPSVDPADSLQGRQWPCWQTYLPYRPRFRAGSLRDSSDASISLSSAARLPGSPASDFYHCTTHTSPENGTVHSSPISSTSEVFYNAPEDNDYQTRRSMYRLRGTASSLDLAIFH
ncbi:hypothetical protein BD310DRAFT_835616 [Dichomitus squalens]|uniref:Uncharacterized protein n=1 Tax=Dichomitus squalens TaxID=114155 RepID=A0A4Q9PFF0_9APHY|nr:hypothetical protein BD310DRAFT_835616 [Dichomitus squalens]